MLKIDLHTHTYYCDGKDSPEDMVLSAIDKGLETYGFSGHSYASYDLDCCQKPDGTAAYWNDIRSLKEKYKGRIGLLCGIEQDIFAPAPVYPYDYIIGSVHYLKTPQGYFSVDYTEDMTRQLIDNCFGGDFYAMAESYFETVSRVFELTGCDIVGHFDLVSKFNEDGSMFDPDHPRYVNAWQKAADRLIKDMKAAGRIPVFEVNVGAISRGYRSWPYPSLDMMRYMIAGGGELILSSDAHKKENIAYRFGEWEERLTSLGIAVSGGPQLQFLSKQTD